MRLNLFLRAFAVQQLRKAEQHLEAVYTPISLGNALIEWHC